MPQASNSSHVRSTADVDDNSIETADIKDANVTLAKLQAGTQGDILYAGASGLWAKLVAGTSGFVLKTLGAGANPVWSAVPPSVFITFFSRAGNTADGDTVLAHGLGATPSKVIVNASVVPSDAGANSRSLSVGTFTTSGSVYEMNYDFHKALTGDISGHSTTKIINLEFFTDGNTRQQATIAVDATNVTITWTAVGTPNSSVMQVQVIAIP